MDRRHWLIGAGAWGLLPLVSASRAAASAKGASIRLATTTSVEHSGLLKVLLAEYGQASGVRVVALAVGSGQALDLLRRGDVDVALVHDPVAEARFLREQPGATRAAVMRNDLILVGPARDPAQARGTDVLRALAAIRASGQPFVSRGDRSGTHEAERRLWERLGADPARERARWYREAGVGMGGALAMAAQIAGYTLADRASWLATRDRGRLAVIVEGDRLLVNVYSLILPTAPPIAGSRHDAALAFARWLTSPAGQTVIARFRIAGEPAFTPN
jgi:tungstate transport system substrate-binding protein